MELAKVEVVKRIDDDGIAEVAVKGAIITNLSGTDAAPILEDILQECNPPHVILNLANVRYLDSYSFNWIIRLYKETEKKGGMFAISNPNEDIISLFELSNFGKAVPVFRTYEEARAAILTKDDSKRIAQ